MTQEMSFQLENGERFYCHSCGGVIETTDFKEMFAYVVFSRGQQCVMILCKECHVDKRVLVTGSMIEVIE